ncbi:MAG: hypothetical protein ABSG21_12700, partial [Spirochaetia bacterium]
KGRHEEAAMKTLNLVLFVSFGAVAAFAGPTATDIAYVNKYKDAAFAAGDLKPLKVWSDQKLYKLPDATLMWVFTNGYTVVETPEKVGIRIVSQGGKEITRTFELPSGRTCSVENRERVVWGLMPLPGRFALRISEGELCCWISGQVGVSPA